MKSNRKMDKKIIVVCGASFTSNFGDLLFTDMFHKYIRAQMPDARVVFLKTSHYTRNHLGVQQATRYERRHAAALVYMSGGYFSNAPRRFSLFRMMKRTRYFLNYYRYGLISARQGRPMAIIGVDVGPLYGKVFRLAARRIFNAASLCVVRNTESASYLNRIGVDRAPVVSVDSVIAMPVVEPKVPRDTEIALEEKIVLIHVTKDKKMESYINHVVKAAADVFASPNVRFVVTDDFMLPKNIWLKRAKECLPADRTILYDYDGMTGLREIIKQSDIVITPKLHVAIFASLHNKVIFSFPVHPSKTTRYFRQINYLEHCHPIESVDYDFIVKLFQKRADSPARIPDDMKRLAEQNLSLLDIFLDQL